MTTVDPTNPLNVVTVTTVNFFSTIVYRSHDGGKTWNWSELSEGGVDTCVAFDADGHLFVSYLDGGPNLMESMDKGATFGSPIALVGLSGDKEMMTTGVDPTGPN